MCIVNIECDEKVGWFPCVYICSCAYNQSYFVQCRRPKNGQNGFVVDFVISNSFMYG